jgi:hypothetical protein
MNLFRLVGVSALFFLAGAAAMPAQSVVSPGQLAGPSNGASMRSSFDSEAGTSGVLPTSRIASVEDAHEKRVQAIWVASILAMVGSTTADAVSSWHRHESNGLLASSGGTFGAQGVAIKGGIAALVLAPQIIFRKHRDWHAAFAVGNFAEAGIFAGATIHNVAMH